MKPKVFLDQLTHSIEYRSDGIQCHTYCNVNGEVEFVVYKDFNGNIIDAPKQKIMPKDKKRNVANKQDYFIKLYNKNIQDILKEKRIKDVDENGNTIRRKINPYEAGVFLMLISTVGWQSPYVVHPDENTLMNESAISNYFGIERMQLHKTLQMLNDSGLISIVSNGKGRPNHYMVNANIAFNGRTVDDIKHLDNFGESCEYKPSSIIKYRETEKK